MKSTNTLKAALMIIFLSLSLILPFGKASAQWGGAGGWQMAPGMMGGWGMGWFGMIFMMVFCILVIVGLVFLIKWLIRASRDGESTSHRGRALETIKERYAKGEIDIQEFKEKKQVIES